MPRIPNLGGPANPSWAIGSYGNETYQGPQDAGSNNGARGPLNGQTLGNNNQRFKAPNLGGGNWGGSAAPGTNINPSTPFTPAPSWAVTGFGNETYQGNPNAGSNNGAAGPFNGQTMGSMNAHQKGAGPMGHAPGPGAQNTFGTDAFGYPITSQAASSGPQLQQLNAYRDMNNAVQQWVQKTGFQGDGAYAAFMQANPGWVSQYGPMGGQPGTNSGQSWGTGGGMVPQVAGGNGAR